VIDGILKGLYCVKYILFLYPKAWRAHSSGARSPQQEQDTNNPITNTLHSIPVEFVPPKVFQTTWYSPPTSTLLGLVLASHLASFAHCTQLPSSRRQAFRAWHTFHFKSSAHRLLVSYFRSAEHCLAQLVASFARPLVSTSTTLPGLLCCIGRPLAFYAPKRATPAPSHPISCPPLDRFWTSEPDTWAVTFGYVQLLGIDYSASRAE
jgi:hypothetical protein